ncbi:MAG: site-2 protease family protein [Abditibacteriales bacterium]|nr:site-2 protease family protein [Abditibacteriales bacterium]MDW8366449.1 site-2 protease family protein [Abditibacteriales bacterium]
MRRTVRAGNLLGVPVLVDYSWFITFGAFWVGLANVLPEWYPEMSPFVRWGLAAVATIIGFLCVLLHEWSHCLVARRHQLEVGDITLFLFGGIATLKREPTAAWAEFQLAGAGPLCNVALGGLGLALAASLNQFPFGEAAATFAMILAWSNFGLAFFNLLPGLPLDGGRMLRALLWMVSRNFQRSTRWATRVGQANSLVLIGGGLWLCAYDVLRLPLFQAISPGGVLPEHGTLGLGVGVMVIGCILFSLACQAGRQQEWQHALSGVKMWQVLPTATPTIPADLTVDQVVERFLLPRRESSFPVVRDGHLVGFVTKAKVRALPAADHAKTTAAAIAIPAPPLPTVEAESDAWEVLTLMMERHLDSIGITGNAQFLGIVTQDDLLHWAKRKIDLKL